MTSNISFVESIFFLASRGILSSNKFSFFITYEEWKKGSKIKFKVSLLKFELFLFLALVMYFTSLKKATGLRNRKTRRDEFYMSSKWYLCY